MTNAEADAVKQKGATVTPTHDQGDHQASQKATGAKQATPGPKPQEARKAGRVEKGRRNRVAPRKEGNRDRYRQAHRLEAAHNQGFIFHDLQEDENRDRVPARTEQGARVYKVK